MSVQLSKLQVDEVSGVDEPANELPGWLVTKSKEVGEVIEKVEDAHNGFLTSLDNVGQYLTDAPDDVQAAATTLKAHVIGLADTDDERRSFIGRAVSYFKRKEEIEMTKDELEAILAAHTDSVTKSVGDTLGAVLKEQAEAAAAAEAEAAAAVVVETEVETEVETDEVAKTVSHEDFETLSARVEVLAEAVGKSLDALGAIISKSVKRNALDGQEGGDEEIAKNKDQGPSLSDAFAKAIKEGRADLT